MSRKKEEQMKIAAENAQEQTQEQQAFDPARDRFIPDEKPQAFYNEAYISERDRLNAMFGRLDTYPVVEEKIIYRDPDLSEYVPMSVYKKKSRAASALGILFGIAAVAAVVFALLAFVL